MKKLPTLVLAALLAAGCAQPGGGPPAASGGVERMYVIECGENHVGDLSRWTTPADKGRAHVFGNHCYLIRHAQGWMLWDTGNPDRLAAMPAGLLNPAVGITAFMKKPLAESLREIGVAPAQIQHFAMSHGHGDHSGNASLFAASTIYMQAVEHDAIFGPTPQKFGFIPANFEALRTSRIVKLEGERDVFGDGAVVIKSAPGHTPGSQVLVVRLPKTGLVVLSGDMVHTTANWEAKRAPGFNFSVEQSVRSMKEIEAFMQRTGASIWINHDKEQHAALPKAPRWVE
jgi:N-acyl homoserine lactone hydrolase